MIVGCTVGSAFQRRGAALAPACALVLGMACAFAPGSLAAAANSDAPPRGTIEGRVFNPASGAYLEKARITVAGTPRETFTDSGGNYRLTNVPAGNVSITAFYTGLALQTKSVAVTAGGTTQHDISLAADSPEGTVKLSAFVVTSTKEMDGAAIAINEQRFAANMMNVVSADEFGTIAEGSVGEFLKFMPGISITFEEGDAAEVSMDGVPSNYVPFTVGGFNLASANSTFPGMDDAARTTQLGQSSLNNVARIEVAFTPTPEISGGALAGSINLVPRSAFERSKPVVDWSTYITTRQNEHDIRKTPGPNGKMMRKIFPGFNFTYVKPVNKRFGFTLSAAASTNFAPVAQSRGTSRGAGVATNGNQFPDTTPGVPYRTEVNYNDSLRLTKRSSFAVTVDYRLAANDRIAFSFQYALNDTEHNGNRQTFLVDRVLPGNFSNTYTHSAVGGGTIQKQGGTYDSGGVTYMPSLTYRHDGPVWRSVVGLGHSHATGIIKDGPENGKWQSHFSRRAG